MEGWEKGSLVVMYDIVDDLLYFVMPECACGVRDMLKPTSWRYSVWTVIIFSLRVTPRFRKRRS
jgi:hypothetical protein